MYIWWSVTVVRCQIWYLNQKLNWSFEALEAVDQIQGDFLTGTPLKVLIVRLHSKSSSKCQNLLTKKNLWFLGGSQLKKSPCTWCSPNSWQTCSFHEHHVPTVHQKYIFCRKSILVSWLRAEAYLKVWILMGCTTPHLHYRLAVNSPDLLKTTHRVVIAGYVGQQVVWRVHTRVFQKNTFSRKSKVQSIKQ